MQFHHSVKCLKWQNYFNGQFIDINIHKSKYRGTTTNLQNPKFVINDVDHEDEIDYRVEVQRASSKCSKSTNFAFISRYVVYLLNLQEYLSKDKL